MILVFQKLSSPVPIVYISIGFKFVIENFDKWFSKSGVALRLKLKRPDISHLAILCNTMKYLMYFLEDFFFKNEQCFYWSNNNFSLSNQ